jgi:hypothetical protein
VAFSPSLLTNYNVQQRIHAHACEGKLVCLCSIIAACYGGDVTSDRLMLHRLNSNIRKRRESSALKKKTQTQKQTLTDYFNRVPKYWTSFFLNKFTLKPFSIMF